MVIKNVLKTIFVRDYAEVVSDDAYKCALMMLLESAMMLKVSVMILNSL
jgi:hypothetical protein